MLNDDRFGPDCPNEAFATWDDQMNSNLHNQDRRQETQSRSVFYPIRHSKENSFLSSIVFKSIFTLLFERIESTVISHFEEVTHK